MKSSQIDDALIVRLKADAELAALVPGGVWWDVAPQNAIGVLIVSIADSQDAPQFGGRAWEVTAYSIVAIEPSSSGANATAAADRVDDLLDGAAFGTADFNCTVRRDGGRVRDAVPDDVDKSIRWQFRGARYLVSAMPAIAAPPPPPWVQQSGWIQI